MTVAVRVVKNAEPGTYTSVVMRFEDSDEMAIRSEVTGVPENLLLPDGSHHRSHMPAECASMSGALFAAMKLEDHRYRMTILGLEGTFGEFDADGFAVAASFAVRYAASGSQPVQGETQGRWVLDEVMIVSC